MGQDLTGHAPDPDLSERIVAMAPGVDRRSVPWALRAPLAAMAVIEMAMALPMLLGVHTTGPEHLGRHIGAFAAAYAFGLAAVALRPAKARAMVPVTVALAVAMAGGAIADIARGEVPALGELSHLPEILGMILVWAIATRRHLTSQPDTEANVTRLPERR
jgi:hypothetical protein